MEPTASTAAQSGTQANPNTGSWIQAGISAIELVGTIISSGKMLDAVRLNAILATLGNNQNPFLPKDKKPDYTNLIVIVVLVIVLLALVIAAVKSRKKTA